MPSDQARWAPPGGHGWWAHLVLHAVLARAEPRQAVVHSGGTRDPCPRPGRARSLRCEPYRRAISDASATEVRAIWDAWWDDVALEPQLRAALVQRSKVFVGTYPSEEFFPPAEWHIAALREAGFAEAGVVWRAHDAAVAAALR